jgi:ABC-type transporter Mla subunit MlaD
MNQRPQGHPDYEVSIDVEVTKDAMVYRTVTVHLAQQGLMGQEVIDFVHGDETSGLAENHTEFVGERVPEISELVADNVKRLTGPGSDLVLTIKNAKTFMETLNSSQVPQVIQNAEQLTDTLKREPWRLLWPATKSYSGDEKTHAAKKK